MLKAPGILACWSVPKWIDENITSRLLKKEAQCEWEKRQREEQDEWKAEKRKAEEEKTESKATKLRKLRIFTNHLKTINESIGVIPQTKLGDESMSILNFNNPSKLILCGLNIVIDVD
ncbi:hypothetical protein FA13DRAFT_1799665 [Coprinellus micaceus]|uniref:Uncharacterized protein n=1 Tax=Coprinellus micaceus TaxID=71717 RepID=A0A4Y7SJ36_COPMI|nr:hypothetical protein FA13DRAFT_1799665 [Coprinellus micaceus]